MKVTTYEIVSAYDSINKLKETVGDSKKRAKGVQAIMWFAEEMDKKLKGTVFAIQCGVIYGAFAKGARRFQQIETLLVLEENVAEVDTFDFIVDNILCDIYLELGIYFSLDVMNPKKLQLALMQPGPLFHRIQKEGILFYGQDVLHQ
ncbi:hypothetical protein FJZ31_11875 [Candidatus Poribacteria bacterium]|nr:hypothetical protein [Candidatus Poribacteria bacterium]